jgi:hypothetical protein
MTAQYHSSVCLISPLHDPDGKLLPMLSTYGSALTKLYSGNIGVSVTDQTQPQMITLLKKCGIYCRIVSTEHRFIGEDMKNTLKLGLHFKTHAIHFVDFDRALHWVKKFPIELRDIVRLVASSNGFISFVRTKRAFLTHPYTQQSTEKVINMIASEEAKRTVDIMSGSFAFETSFAKIAIQELKRKDFGVYAEFLMIALRHKFLIDTIEVDGLEWETPDQFQDEIRRTSYDTWLHNFQSLSEWQKRIALLEDSLDTLLQK